MLAEHFEKNTARVKPRRERVDALSEKFSKTGKKCSAEDMDVLFQIENLKDSIALMHQNLDNVTDEALIDGYIYELKAVHMKYQYYLRLCKEKGLAAF